MQKIKLNKWFVGIFSFFIFLYLVFLSLPLFSGFILNKFTPQITSEIKKQTGLLVEINNPRIVVTPKLTAGLKVGNLKGLDKNGKNFLDVDNLQIKLSLIKILLRNIELDLISSDKVNVNLYLKNDGNFELLDSIIIPPSNNENVENNSNSNFELPFGFKLSNKLPDIRIKNYNISFIDSSNKIYSIQGENTNLVDFVINKGFKFNSNGKIILDNTNPFNYDIKLSNKIMPDMSLEDLINSASSDSSKPAPKLQEPINIAEIFKLIKNYGITSNLVMDLDVKGDINSPVLNGKINLSDLSILIKGKKLPNSSLELLFNGDEHKISSSLFTAQNEQTKINGLIKQGKNPKIDLSVKSNATLTSIFEIVDYLAQTVGVKDLKTLSAKGKLDIDFNIKSDFKKLTSNGYIKLVNGLINYGLYDVKIENIIADILLNNNNVQINNLGFSALSIPFSVKGKISENSNLNININTSALPLKGLLVSLGQASLLKENPLKSGLLTLNANIKGAILSPQINGNVIINNFSMKNIPSDINLSFNPLSIKLNTTKDGKYNGSINAKSLLLNNPALKVKIPVINGTIDEKNIVFSDTNVSFGKNNLVVYGKIQEYLTNKILLDFNTKGTLNSSLKGSIDPYKMNLNLVYSTLSEYSSLIIPMFDKSSLKFKGSTSIEGSMNNPKLKGEFFIDKVSIPEIPVQIKNMKAVLNGPILLGNAEIGEFISGGIAAKNIKSDYKMLGSSFYLNNLTGEAFDGKFDGNIEYNMSNFNTKVKLKGSAMNALKAIEGAIGIKNALSGTLGFNVNISLLALDYNAMMKSLKGFLDFEVKDGVLLNLGGLDKLISAQNILSITPLKPYVSKALNLSGIKSASEFQYIKGSMNFKNGIANISSINISGPLMAYNVKGSYNLLTNFANVIILGRLASSISSSLGAIGDFAVNKLTSVSPIFSTLTSSIAKQLNESPKNVDLNSIPQLKSSNIESKLFKVVFNGGILQPSSVKSFKWLNDIDTSEIDSKNKDIQNALNKVQSTINKESVKQKADEVKKQAQTFKEDVKTQTIQTKEAVKEQIKTQAKEQAKQLFNSLLNTNN